MEKRYNLILTGLQAPTLDPEDLIQALRTKLNFESMTARLAVSRTPFTLLREINYEEGMQLKYELEEHGALIDLQDTSAPSPLSNDPFSNNQDAPAPLLGNFDAKWDTAPPPTKFELPFTTHLDELPPQTGRPLQQEAPLMAPMMSASAPEVDFFGSLVQAFLMPLKGRGISWMLLIGIFTLVALFAFIGITIVTLIIPFVGVVINALVFGALLTLNARFFFATFSAAVNDEEQPEPFPDLSERRSELLLGGLVLLGWFFTAFLPLYLWISRMGGNPRQGGLSLVIFFLLVLLPFFFWPISLVQMASGSIARMWNFPASIAAILKTPLKYGLIVLFGFLAGILPLLVSSAISRSLGGGFMVGLITTFLGCLPMAYSHGVMGAMMGFLAQETPEILPEGIHNEEH